MKSEFVQRNLERNVQPWEYCEVGKALNLALSKYTKEEVAQATGVTSVMVARWKQKTRIPSRINFEKLKNIDSLIQKL